MDKSTTIAIFIIFLIFGLIIIIALSNQPHLNNDSAITTSPTPNSQAQLICDHESLDWGNITSYGVLLQHVTLTNTGTADTNPLNMTNTCNVGKLTWNREGQVIPANASLLVSITLLPSRNAPQGPFTFDITINY